MNRSSETSNAMTEAGPEQATTGVEAGLRISALAVAINALLAIGKIVTGDRGKFLCPHCRRHRIHGRHFQFVHCLGRAANRGEAGRRRSSIRTRQGGVDCGGSRVANVAGGGLADRGAKHRRNPHASSCAAWFTLVVLLGVIAIKETLYRFVFTVGHSLGSSALKGDAWHHRSDAITSAAAFIGISIALLGGPGFESADDWAALAACSVIAWNGLRLLRGALDEVMDASASSGDRGPGKAHRWRSGRRRRD